MSIHGLQGLLVMAYERNLKAEEVTADGSGTGTPSSPADSLGRERSVEVVRK